MVKDYIQNPENGQIDSLKEIIKLIMFCQNEEVEEIWENLLNRNQNYIFKDKRLKMMKGYIEAER